MPLGLGALAVAAVAAVPVLGSQSTVFFWETVLVQVLFATSVNLLVGYANMPSFGQAAFFGIGAYTVAELAPHLPVPLSLLGAILVSGVCAALIGLLAVRVSGIAFSMITLAIAEGLYLVVYQTPTFGGENGIPNILPGSLGTQAFWWLLVAGVGVGMAGLYGIVRSPFGLVLQGIREDPKRTQFLGVHVFWRRFWAFVFAGAAAGVAGGLMAYASGVVAPDTLNWTQSGYPIIMALVGGLRTFWGPALGAVLITWVLQVFGQATPAYLLPVGAVLLAVLLVAPEGLLPKGLALLRRLTGGPAA
jgi:branched-chain amino acid transport system permease protein